MQGKDGKFLKGHKLVLKKSKICNLCNLPFKPLMNGQKYCGSYSKRIGCSWKQYKEKSKIKRKLQTVKEKSNPNYLTIIRNRMLKNKYNISQNDYLIMVTKQNGLCKICGKKCSLVIDHDHETGQIRGLLCDRCNLGLGNFKDNPLLLINAIEYIKKYGK